MTDAPPQDLYELIDSGGGARLEQFGEKILIRPSSLAVWKRALPDLWRSTDAEFVPKSGWKGLASEQEVWETTLCGVRLNLRLQTNGQIGCFPEHSEAAPFLRSFLGARARPSVLNLFAFTGLLTLVASQHGAAVTHLDNSKRALEWCRENVQLNGLESSAIRYIPDDALVFLERELRRENRYDAVIADPPSFSRPAKGETWDLDSVMPRLIELCTAVLKPDGLLILSCHHPSLSPPVLQNLLRDLDSHGAFHQRHLGLKDRAGRTLPAGGMIVWERGR